MNRTVIDINMVNNGPGMATLSLRLIEPADTFPGSDTSVPLTCTVADAPFAAINGGPLANNAIQQAGAHLRDGLFGQSAVCQAIKTALTAQPNGAAPIYLYLRREAEIADALPWEMLCDPDGSFLTLDSRWQVGRMSGGLPGAIVERSFNPPIRVLAFLAATGIEARPEWDALYDALVAAQLPVKLQVYVCEPDLEAHISSLPPDPNVHVRVSFLPQSLDFAELIENADHAPHIVHFFCHGSTEDGPALQLSTQADWEHGVSSIALEPKEFGRLPGLADTLWLVTLNCCESAATEQETSSFARTLVGDIKVPAVVAMREAVKVEDANLFCGSFYRALLNEIKPSLEAGQPPVPIEWARALYEPRFAICKANAEGKPFSKAAAGSKEWALPVVYVRAEQFRLRALSEASPLNDHQRLSARAEIDTLRQLLDMLRGKVPPGALADIEAQIAGLEAQAFPPGV